MGFETRYDVRQDTVILETTFENDKFDEQSPNIFHLKKERERVQPNPFTALFHKRPKPLCESRTYSQQSLFVSVQEHCAEGEDLFPGIALTLWAFSRCVWAAWGAS